MSLDFVINIYCIDFESHITINFETNSTFDLYPKYSNHINYLSL